jgi:hypothetical protein
VAHHSLLEWMRFDLGARYTFENPGGNQATTLFLGAPRTFALSLTADFQDRSRPSEFSIANNSHLR